MPEETATCERCGTFAILRSNGFRRWCDPCWLTASHAVDRPLHSVEALYKATFELLREYWWLSFFLVILTRVGPEMAVEASQAPAALRFGFNIVAASVAETIVLSVVLAKTLRGRQAIEWPFVRARFRARFLRVVAVNAVTGVLGTLGCFLCAVPGLLITAVCAAAVPFVLFEELSIIDALDASIRRSWPMIWNFIALSLPFALLSGIVGSAPTLFRIVVLKQPPQPPFGLLMLGERTLFAFTTIPNILLQVVCWAATRPAPALSETNDGNAVAAVARG